ncbi:MAG TPA: helix-turn-helix transcriptional regulator [Tepidisphaeraceae bacterium]|nr:helix-turn-helix transcriptional regulator [Tepidisphaeraceae bacterium]
MSMFDQVQRDDAWVLRMADAEEGVSIEVGGLQGRLEALKTEATRRSLAHFIELSRRQLGLSSVQFAEKAQVSLTELIAVETSKGTIGSCETVIRLAAFLGLDAEPLLCLAGLSSSEDRQLDAVAVQFTARLEPVAPLEPREQEALDWFKSEAFRPRHHAVRVG